MSFLCLVGTQILEELSFSCLVSELYTLSHLGCSLHLVGKEK